MSRSTRAKFDALTLSLEQADQLVGHLAARLDAVAEECHVEEANALSLIASSIRDRLRLVGDQVEALVQ